MSLIIHAGASPGTRDDEAGAGENRLRERAEESRGLMARREGRSYSGHDP
jgi:hypothetical protein